MLNTILHSTNNFSFSSSSSSLCLYTCQWQPASIAKAKSVSSLASATSSGGRKARRSGRIRCAGEADQAKVSILTKTKSPTKVMAVVTVKAAGSLFTHIGITRGLDDITDLLGRTLYLELLSNELDPKTGLEKEPAGDFAHRISQGSEEAKYEGEFLIPKDFGEIGGILVTNEHHKEMFIKDIVLSIGDETTALTIDCQSWVHSKFDNPEKRIFFTNKSYLPSETPSGLQKRREQELKVLRGNGTGERKIFERIYDYDVYNDLGDPDSKEEKARPVLGGSKEFPYPRRCRTGRAPTKKDLSSEKREGDFYIPRDEAFSEVKQAQFSTKTLRSVLRALVPYINSALVDKKVGFPYFTAIDSLYDEGIILRSMGATDQGGLFSNFIPRLIKTVSEVDDLLLRFETPELMDRDKFSWFRDEEFSRQTLAGINPLRIELIREFPIVSKLDPEIYGPAESGITKEIVEREIKGFMTVEQALKEKKLFILDYHDLFLPYVHKVRSIENTTLYGSRTVFFLNPDDTLRPIAIELTRPKSPTRPQWRHVFTHAWDATGTWLWRLAKAHVGAHDSGYHQLVSHWLRTHCSAEPYIIAANRQLSAMHPIYRLLLPHFRYTMEINSLAREFLISAEGIIEQSFSPGKYSMELCSVAYGLQWRFDMEALPADLIRRGLAVEDPTAENGLRLTINDYPYAADGLLIWSAIKQWVTDYVAHYYPSPAQVLNDPELQAWWAEVRNVGHGDKKDEPWWPVLDSSESLVGILTTIIWTVSGHHAAVNFGQYHYAGYFPNRPTITRVNLPVEEGEPVSRLNEFRHRPEAELLKTFPSQQQATVVIAVLDILSTHSPEEEYIGDVPEPAFAAEPAVREAFERFNSRLKEVEGIIDGRNSDMRLKNRCGVGIVPYELLKPYSEAGVTGKGVPNSISI